MMNIVNRWLCAVLVLGAAVCVESDAVTLSDGTTISSPGAPAPKREGLRFKEKRMSGAAHSPRVSRVSVKLSDASDKESSSVERDRLVGSLEAEEKSDVRHVRAVLRSAQSSYLRNLQLYIQYYAKPAGGSGDPRLVTQKQVPISALDSRLVYIDVAPVSIESLSRSRTFHTSREYSQTVGDKFYGYVVTVVDANNTVLYQGASNGTLAKLAEKPAAQAREVQQPAFDNADEEDINTPRRLRGRPFRPKLR